MRFFLLFLIVASASVLSAPIADFAPDQIGNVWKYKVRHFEDIETFPSSPLFIHAYLTRTFQLAKAEITSNFKRNIFDLIDSGIDSSNISLTGKPTVSIIQNHYLDTCFQFGDSIPYTWPDYIGGQFVPFFKYHVISSDTPGLVKILYKNDSLFQFTTVYNFKYIQNIGLDSLWGFTPNNTVYSLSIKLISFTPAPTSIAQSPKKFNPVQTTRQNVPSAYIFDLQGRRFQQRSLSALPPGLMINRGKSYLQVK